MTQYADKERTIGEAVRDGGLLVVAQWEAKDGEAEKVAGILDRFLPEAQAEPGMKLFLIGRGKDNPAQFLFYELFRDEAAFKAHQDSAHFKTYIAGQALPLLAKRERTQYALISAYDGLQTSPPKGEVASLRNEQSGWGSAPPPASPPSKHPTVGYSLGYRCATPSGEWCRIATGWSAAGALA